MKIIPKRKIELQTKLTKEDIQTILLENTEYKGSVSLDHFKIYRIIDYRNSFLPRIKGNIYDEYNATRVEVTMQLHRFVLVFMAIWLVGVLLFCGVFISNISLSDISLSDFDMFDLIPFIMPIVAVLMVYIPFSIECRKSEKDLQRILEAEIIRKY